MADWYYSESGEQKGPVRQHQLEQMLSQGSLPGSSLVWTEGMSEWEPASTVFSMPAASPRPTPIAIHTPGPETAICAVTGATRPVSEMLQYGDKFVSPERKDEFVQTLREGAPLPNVPSSGEYVYADPSGRAKITIILFVLGTILEVLSTISSYFASDPNDLDAFNAADLFTTVGALSFLVLYLVGVVFYCMWKHRVCRNAHALGGTNMSFTPGWSVGYYFIPVLLLWKPFQAMREIWNVTFNKAIDEGAPSVMGVWWTLWIVSNFLGQISFRLTMNDLHEFVPIVDGIASLVAIGMLFSILKIIKSITDEQVKRSGTL